ncbi:MAG TPA: phosphoglucomutase/phosphomannomutase family protein [Dehalococcoidia bacterium]|jgi:alpha-D-glucose phosphate-specific phosphoglucomutase|nr:phosphoglucomutase/phosphomannomutase family protein [Dehalococcoidia bacterium]
MKSEIKFGTDGWRGIIAQDFTFDNVRACAQGVADYLKQSGLASRGLIIGYDTRFASEDFAAAAAEVVAGNGIKVYLCSKATPTPVISFGVLAKKTGGAIIITASHNPGIWNGFKYKDEHGASAPGEVTAQIEKFIARALAAREIPRLPLDKALGQGLVAYLDLAPVYLEQISRLVDLDGIRQAGLKVIVDSMYGAGAGYLKRLLEGGATELVEINGERNPLFPGMVRPEPIALNLGRLSTMVREEMANVGLATDGDADRMGVIDEKGVFLTQLQVFALLCLYLLEVRGERGPLVKTITTTSMIYRLGEIFKVPVYETTVGFKHVAPIMLTERALIGGEESGGYGFRGHVAERDGILASLYFLDLMIKTGKTPSELLEYLYRKVGPHYYERVDIEFPEGERQAIIEHLKESLPQSIEGVKVARIDTSDGFRFILVDNTWLLIRFSGTEPVLRIYAESDSQARVERLLEFGKELAGVK